MEPLSAAFGAALLLAPAARAEPHLRVVAPELDPYVVAADGRPAGPVVDLARAVMRRFDPASPPELEIVPLPRVFAMLEEGGTICPILVRTPAREPAYRWIGEVLRDPVAFASLDPTPTVDTWESARGFGNVIARRGAITETMLVENGFAPILAGPAETNDAGMLAARRGDLWLASIPVLQSNWRKAGEAGLPLHIGRPVAEVPFWLAASKDLDPELAVRLQIAFRDAVASGDYRRAMAPLLPVPSGFGS